MRHGRMRHGSSKRNWTLAEIKFLHKFYCRYETAWICRQLGRTVYSVRYKASDLCIRKANPSIWRGNKGKATAFKALNNSERYGRRLAVKRRKPLSRTRRW